MLAPMDFPVDARITVSSYAFLDWAQLPGFEAGGGLLGLRVRLRNTCQRLDLKGTVLLASEGINLFIAGHPPDIKNFKKYLSEVVGISGLCYQQGVCGQDPFNRMLVKLKKEIISMGCPEIEPRKHTAPRISPAELKQWLESRRGDFVLLDTRNDYEVSVGTFETAEHLELDSFREFPDRVVDFPPEWKEKDIVTFCTGGIRCEKASALLLTRGYQKVYQLDGGILGYFAENGGAHYQGDCFVFDWREAVDGNLNPVERAAALGLPVHPGRHQISED